jgi:hypothetical protein
MNKTQKPGHPPNAEDVFDTICGFSAGQRQVSIETEDEGLALWSYIEAVVEAETGYLERHFEVQREEHAMKVKSSMHKGVVMGISRHASEGFG